MAGGGLRLAETFLHFLRIKGSVKRFNCIERHVGEAERKSFVDAKDSALKEEMELTIKHDFNGNRPFGTIPLTISYGEKHNLKFMLYQIHLIANKFIILTLFMIKK